MANFATMASRAAVGTPQPTATHVITIPGTRFTCFVNADVTDTAALMIKLSRTTTPAGRGSKRRPKAVPALQTLTEWNK